MTDTKDKTLDAGEADEDLMRKRVYPAFQGLLHLKALGGIDDLSDFAVNNRWSDLKTRNPIRVALIDTPVAYDHPNLKGANDLSLMRDFWQNAMAQAATPMPRQNFSERMAPQWPG